MGVGFPGSVIGKERNANVRVCATQACERGGVMGVGFPGSWKAIGKATLTLVCASVTQACERGGAMGAGFPGGWKAIKKARNVHIRVCERDASVRAWRHP